MPDDGVHVYTVGVWLVVASKSGVQVMWDGGTRVQVTLRPEFKYEVYGLLGYYNGKSADDFTTAAGGVESSANEFARSWKTGDGQDFADMGGPTESACTVRRWA